MKSFFKMWQAANPDVSEIVKSKKLTDWGKSL